jgi:hypothetical protein
MQRVSYVYALLDGSKKGPFEYLGYTFSHLPFYIGKGKNTRIFNHQERAFHKKDGKFIDDTLKARKIRKMIRQGIEVLPVFIKQHMTDASAVRFEMKAIKSIGRIPDGPLVNLTAGGDGLAGFTKSDATLQKMSVSKTIAWSRISAVEREMFSSKLRAATKRNWDRVSPAAVKARRIKTQKTWAAKPKSMCLYCLRKFGDIKAHTSACKFKELSAKERDIRLFGTPQERASLVSKKISESAARRPTLTCPHCSKQGKPPAMYKWHFDECTQG